MLANLPKLVPAIGRTHYFVLPDNLSLEQVSTAILSLEKDIDKGEKIRIIWDNPEFSSVIQSSLNILQKQSSNLVTQNYQTVFYRSTRRQILEQIENYPQTNWQNYSTDFSYQSVSLDSEDYSVVKNFCMNSNGVKFEKIDGKTVITPNPEMQGIIAKQLPIAMQNPANTIFLVQKDTPLEYVGCFSLLRVNQNEVQLHYISGKSDLDNVYTGKKMPVLAAAVLDILQKNYSEDIYLTFSNKDTATVAVYQGVGFQPYTDRKCILLKKNMTSSDLN